MNGGSVLRVAAGVIMGRDGSVLLTRRVHGTPYSGFWEFPGGKLEVGESPHDALVRELHEELGIRVTRAAAWLTRRFVYPHAHVELHFFRVFAWEGELDGRQGQTMSWQTPGAFNVSPLLPANAAVLRALELPAIYGITMADDLASSDADARSGSAAFDGGFVERFRTAVHEGLRMIQLREKTFSRARLAAIAGELIAIARPYNAKLLLNGDEALARSLGCDGVHWPSALLMAQRARPGDDFLCAASCHDVDELDHAAKLGLDFAVLGPVNPTPLHGNSIGWEGFAKISREASIPIYALGGLGYADLPTAIANGAHGVALRRAAWTAG